MLRLEPGHRIAKYRLEHELDRGGMGVVYQAVNVALNKRVALKILHLPFADEDDNRVRRFLNEGIAASRVRHPAIIEVFDAGVEDGLPWMALELLEGESLRDAMLRNGPLPAEEAVHITLGVLAGLEAAHAKDIVHRDIKPANIFLTRDGDSVAVKLLDFGVAKLIDTDDESMRMTRTEAVLGTAYYLSPEQAESSAKVTSATDIYALGATLFEMLSGRLPYEAEGFGALMRRLFTESPQELSAVAPELPDGLAAIVMGCIDHDPAKRLRASALAGALRRCVPDAAMSASRMEIKGPASIPLNAAGTHDTVTSDGSNLLLTGDAPLLPTLASEADVLPEIPPTYVNEGEEKEAENVAPEAPAPEPLDDTAQPNRTWLWVALMAVTLLGVGLGVWWSQRGGAPSEREPVGSTRPEGPVVRFGFIPAIDPEIILREAEPLRLYLEEKLALPVDFVMTDSYADAVARLYRGELEFSMVAPLSYVKIMDDLRGLQPIVSREFDGVVEDEPIAVVRRDSDIDTWEDMRGRTFCLINRDSSTGYLLPRQQIRLLGHAPDTFMGDIQWSGKHHQALRDLLDGRCDVACTYTGSWQSADQAGIPVIRLRSIRTAGRIPHNIVVASTSASPELQEAMREVLVAFDPQDVVGEPVLGEVRRISGFQAPSMESYLVLRAAWRAEQQYQLSHEMLGAALMGGLRRAQ